MCQIIREIWSLFLFCILLVYTRIVSSFFTFQSALPSWNFLRDKNKPEFPMAVSTLSPATAALNSSDSDEGINVSHNSTFWSSTTSRKKTSIRMNDTIHPHLDLPAICAKIIDTPQFQRLRYLKQLGFGYFVYPAASHNRFEHCIGTAYLAGKYCKILQRNQPELDIDERDVLCVQIAGLCHDLGHGPFSHSWEHFMRRYSETYNHEDMSIRMLDYLVQDNRLWELFEAEGLDQKDLVFIKELILGHPMPGNAVFQGRPASKFFLYQIVSNEETKIDVDKFDYLLRDSKQLNVSTAFDYQRLIDNSRVVQVSDADGNKMTKIIYRKKITTCLEDLFKGRFHLHQIAYQHRVTMIIEEMVLDGLHAAERYFQVFSDNGTPYKLSTAYQDLSAFMKLTDVVFELILNWGTSEAVDARNLFRRVVRRDLYKSLGYTTSEIKKETWEELYRDTNESLCLIPTNINFGKGSLNPLNNALFYEKQHPDNFLRLELGPPSIERKFYIVYKPSVQDYSNKQPVITPKVDFESTKSKLAKWSEQHGIDIFSE